ncbi:hypothetical protein C806_00420 [Lachnospiraceae bacterium 3-1]|nr:hypothetical protein C806_00420 [Lachnospiraceae bacterium 3-1]
MLRFSKLQMKREMKRLYPAPNPQRKEEFLREFPYFRASCMEIIRNQIGYIQKSIWIFSLLLVIGGVAVGDYLDTGSNYDKIWCMSGIMPLLAVLAVTETFRSSVYGMTELEMACKHNLSQVLLIRMGVLGGVDFLLMVFGVLWIVGQGTIGMVQAAVYLMVPWLSACIVAFQIEKYTRGRETVWYCTAWGCFLWGVHGIGSKLREMVYGEEKFYLWFIAFCICIVFFAKQIWQIYQETEEWRNGCGASI